MTSRGARHDARTLARVVHRHARTFTWASSFLPAEKRRGTNAFYAFCREADDLVDVEATGNAAGPAAALAAFGREYDDALGGRPRRALFREVVWAIDRFDVPPGVLHDLLAGVARDLAPVRYETWSELSRYCAGVASTVGEMCTCVFGTTGRGDTRRDAVGYARTLGVAMQLTNILRDVGEDARRGRCYLPVEDLAAFGLSRGEVFDAVRQDGRPAGALAADPRWHALVRFEISRARSLYEEARPGIALLAADARACAEACAAGYAAILTAIERRNYDSLGGRARLGLAARAWVLWAAWRRSAARTTEETPGGVPTPLPRLAHSPGARLWATRPLTEPEMAREAVLATSDAREPGPG